MINLIKRAIILLFFVSICCNMANGQIPTQLTIRALAKDAKFIGTGIGGAYIVVKNHYTQEILSKGYTTGASGNTSLIVNQAKERYKRITDDKTAKFVASININEPTLVDIEAVAPFGRRHAAIKSTTQIWAIPRKDILGEGIILEIPGFIIDILSPKTHEVISFSGNQNKEITVKVNMVMMCGCVIQNGGVWDANNYDVSASLIKEGKEISKHKLIKTDEDNIFELKISLSESGNYGIVVTAFDNKASNTGVDKINFVIK